MQEDAQNLLHYLGMVDFELAAKRDCDLIGFADVSEQDWKDLLKGWDGLSHRANPTACLSVGSASLNIRIIPECSNLKRNKLQTL